MPSRVPKIFMIEDDIELCRGWEEIFKLLEYPVRCHQRGLEALRDVEALSGADILITDYYLPDINGAVLIRRLRDLGFELPCIVLTGSREASVVKAVEGLPNCTLLHKPINIEALEKQILKILSSRVSAASG